MALASSSGFCGSGTGGMTSMDIETASSLSHEARVYLLIMLALAGALIGFAIAIWCDSRERQRAIEEERKRVANRIDRRTQQP